MKLFAAELTLSSSSLDRREQNVLAVSVWIGGSRTLLLDAIWTYYMI